MNRPLTLAMVVYIAAIVAANTLTTHLGLVPVGFGLVVVAGTYAAGAALLARDFVHRYGGAWWALAGITAGAALSLLTSDPALALASLAAFTLAELLDLLVFARLRDRGFVRAAGISNCLSAPVDTVVFLALAGFPVTWPVVAGQLVGKLLWATLIPLTIYVGARRALLREPVYAAGA